MISIGIKRGLASVAVSALAVAALPLLSAGPAQAAAIGDTLGANATNLFTQFSGQASIQNDGVNNTIHLLAGGGANVTQVRFEYGPVGTPTTIATVDRGPNGAFSYEWSPPVELFGTQVVIRAVGLNSVGTPAGGTADANTATVGAAVPAIDIANAPNSTLGVFRQPYGVEAAQEPAGSPQAGIDHSTQQGIVTGTTSGAGAVTLTDPIYGSAPRPAVTPGTPDANGIRSFRGTVNFQNYPALDTTAPVVNQAVIGASQAGGSDDAEAVNLVQQTISTVTAAATPASVPNGTTATGVVTVTDATGAPLAGAQVIFDRNNDGVWDYNGVDNTANNADDEPSLYTNANGQANFTGLAGTAAGTTYAFFVNTDDGDNYDPAIDFRRTVTVTSFAQVASAVTTTSADGDVFDVNEFATGDLKVRVADQNGTGFAGQTVSYSISFTPFSQTTPATVYPTQTGTVVSGADGTANIPFTPQTVGNPAQPASGTYTLRAFIDRDGTPGQGAGDLSAADRVFKAGDAFLAFNPSNPAVAGTSTTRTVTLKLEDGTPLAGRLVNFTFNRAGGGNAVIAAQADQPAGTTRGGDTTASAVTSSTGAASVVIADPAAPPAAEIGGTLSAATGTNTFGNAAETATPSPVDFTVGTAPAGSTAVVTPATSTGKPGVAVSHTVTLTAPDGADAGAERDPVAGATVTLTVSNGFFTDGSFDPARAAGANTGELTSLGKTTTVTTNGAGQATFLTDIERDAGFDDDGLVASTVTASINGATAGTATDNWSSANPLNAGAVDLAFATSGQNSGILPKAPVGDDVLVDVFTTDQFGNRYSTDDNNPATPGVISVASTQGGAPSVVNSDFDTTGDLTITGASAGDVTLTATYAGAPSSTFGPAPTFTVTPGTKTLTDTLVVSFYAVDYSKSTFTLKHAGANVRNVGGTVIETYTATDQFGEPISAVYVQFFRSGPDANQDGEQVQASGLLGQDGTLTYVFQGAVAGNAVITAVLRNGGPQGSVIGAGTRTDTIKFTKTAVTPGATLNLTGRSSANKKQDIITAKVTTTGKTTSSKLSLYRVVNGRNVLISTRTVGSDKAVTYIVADKNGGKSTKYVAILAAGSTKAAQRAVFVN